MSSRVALLLAMFAAALVALASAYPQGYSEPEPYKPYVEPRQGYAKPAAGRVKIQTYRGPTKGKGYDVHAPWGYYVTQPEDDKPKYY